MTSQLSCLVWNHYHKWGKLRQSKTLASSVADVDLTTQGRKARALSSTDGTGLLREHRVMEAGGASETDAKLKTFDDTTLRVAATAGAQVAYGHGAGQSLKSLGPYSFCPPDVQAAAAAMGITYDCMFPNGPGSWPFSQQTMPVEVIPPRFTLERIPVLLTPSLLTADVDVKEVTPGVQFPNLDSWNSLSARTIRHADHHTYSRHPNCPVTAGLVPDFIARAEFCVWQEMIIGQSLPSPSIQVKSWAFGFQFAHSKAIRCRQDKLEAHRFDISGANGVHGARGSHGADGSSGNSGRDGSNGSDGSDGSDGGHGRPDSHHAGGNGSPGSPGQDAGSAVLELIGASGPLTSSVNVKFGRDVNSLSPHAINAPNRGVIVIFAKGGCGGWGGNGGKGGNGGSGGKGGKGGNGVDGRDAEPARDGGDGGRGGNGGDGGRGGDGADGGSPAPGALAGRGGNVVVSTQDPKLLMLVECDVRGGFGGRGGLGGIPGSAGHGGSSGSGGSGGRAGRGGKEITTKDSAGKTVVVQKAGKPGKSGSSGSSGRSGTNGSSGRGTQNCYNLSNGPDGSVSFVVLDSNGATLQQATERFNLTVSNYIVHDDNTDGIFEPGSDLFIDNISILNNGGLTCPDGSILWAPTTSTAHQMHQAVTLPAIAVGQSFTACSKGSDGLRMHIPTVPGPCVGKPFVSVARIAPAVTLCDRFFDEASPSVFVTVQYPIRITVTHALTLMAPTENGMVTIEVMNISKVPYGCSVGSSHACHLLFKMDRNMEILPSPNEAADAMIYPDGLAAKADIRLIAPGATVSVTFHVRMRESAGNMLYSQLPWDATLFLRDQPIEIRSNDIRVTPKYNDAKTSDIVIVTTPNTTREEFLVWSYLVQQLGLSTGFWDHERYRGMRACPDLGPASEQFPTPVQGLLPNFHIPPAGILAQLTPTELKELAKRIGLPEHATADGVASFIAIAHESGVGYSGRHWLHRCRTLVVPRGGDVSQGGVNIESFVPSDIEQHIRGLCRKDRDAFRQHLLGLAAPASQAQMDSIAEHFSSHHNSKSLLTMGWKPNSLAPVLFNHAAPLPDQSKLQNVEVFHCCLPLWYDFVMDEIKKDDQKRIAYDAGGRLSTGAMLNVMMQRLSIGCPDSTRRGHELGFMAKCNNYCWVGCVEPCLILKAFQDPGEGDRDTELSRAIKLSKVKGKRSLCSSKGKRRLQVEMFSAKPEAAGCNPETLKTCSCCSMIVGKMIKHKASVYRSDNYLNVKHKHALMSATPELLPYRYVADEAVADSRVGMFQPVETPLPLAAPYIQMLISVAAVQPALKVLEYITGTGSCPSLMTKLRISFNAHPQEGLCSGLCQSCCGAAPEPIPITLTNVDVGFAVLVSHIMREVNDDSLLNTTAFVVAIFAESQSMNISLEDKVTLCCVIRRARYELGSGSLFGGALLSGFPWFFTRGARVSAELKAIEARVLAVAETACTTPAHRDFLSQSLAAAWSRPQLADLLLIKRIDALTPANDERKMGDDMDTVSTQEVQELLHSRALERRQPNSANTMYAVPPAAGWYAAPQARWHAPPPPPVQAAPMQGPAPTQSPIPTASAPPSNAEEEADDEEDHEKHDHNNDGGNSEEESHEEDHEEDDHNNDGGNSEEESHEEDHEEDDHNNDGGNSD